MRQDNATKPVPNFRVRVGFLITLFGFLVFLIGAKPNWFALDRRPIVGFVQIAVFLIGLGIICVGGYIALASLWNGSPKSIASDIGLRLVATGFLIAVASGMADVFGFGTEKIPGVPHFGRLQTIGVLLGEAVIAVGFLLLIPYRPRKEPDKSSQF